MMTKNFSESRAHRPFRSTLWRGFPLLLAASLLSGCVVGPDYARPSVSAFSFVGKAHRDGSVPSIQEWWKQFNDPVLTALIDKAVEGNLTVASAKAKVREARASYKVSTGADLPSVDGASSAKRSRNGDQSPTYLVQSGLDASWEIDLFGANRRSKEAARAGLDAAEEDLRASLVTLIGDVSVNYVNARGYQARIALSKRTAASQRQSLDLVLDKQRLGSGTELDVQNAKGQVATTETNIPDLEIAYAGAVYRLSILTGQDPTALVSLMGKMRPVPSATFRVIRGIGAAAIAARPDVRVAERNLAKATANIGIAEANRYPGISLTGSISTAGAKIGDLAKSSTISWAIGPSLSVPIFNNGKLKASVDVAKAQRDQSFLAYQAAVINGLEDVENAVVALSQDRVKLSKVSEAAASYRSVTQLTQSSYDSGASNFLDVLSAERSLYSAESSVIQSKVSLALAYIALNKALGAGWNGAVDSRKPVVVDQKVGPHAVSR
jgi:NodT family efflux transporter outer membrane factor (OMF) lipoprotein